MCITVSFVKEYKDAIGKKNVALRSLKKKTDAVETDLNRISADILAIAKKGYTESMRAFLDGNLEEVRTELKTAVSFYCTHITEKDSADPSQLKHVEGIASAAYGEYARIHGIKQAFDKTTGQDIKNLVPKA